MARAAPCRPIHCELHDQCVARIDEFVTPPPERALRACRQRDFRPSIASCSLDPLCRQRCALKELPGGGECICGIDTSVPGQPGADTQFPTGLMSAAKNLGLLRVLTAIGFADDNNPAHSD